MTAKVKRQKKPLPVQRFAVSYLRFSHRRQAKGGSMARQIKATEAYCQKHGLTLIERFADEGVSGFRGKHATKGDLARLIALLDQGKLPSSLTLIIENIDRLTREPMMDALARFTNLVNRGVTIICLDLKDKVFNTATINADPGLLNTVLTVMQRGRDESSTKSTRVSESFTARFDQARIDGLAIRGYRGPAWLDVRDRRYVENPERTAVVREIFRLRISGLGDYSIAATLNERGIPTFPHCAKRGTAGKTSGWYPSYVGEILKSRAVLGEFDPRGAGDPFILFPQIISPSTFADAQAMKRTRNTSVKGARGSKHHNLFMGLTRCVHCGGTMTMTQNRSDSAAKAASRYYVCSNRRRRAEACDVVGMINYGELERSIIASLPDIPWTDIVARENPVNPLTALDAQIAEVRDELQVLKEQNENLTAAVAQASRALPALLKALEETDDRVKLAETRLRHLRNERATKAAIMRPDMVKDAAAFARAMETADPLERFEARSRLMAALSKIITRVDCDVRAKSVTVLISKSFILIVLPKTGKVTGEFTEFTDETIAAMNDAFKDAPKVFVPWSEMRVAAG